MSKKVHIFVVLFVVLTTTIMVMNIIKKISKKIIIEPARFVATFIKGNPVGI